MPKSGQPGMKGTMDEGEVLVVVEIQSIKDQAGMQAYQAAARQQIGKYGGQVIARGGSHVEGAPQFGPVMVQKWPSEAAFRQWQASEEYQPHRRARLGFADLRIAVVPLIPSAPQES